MANIFYDRSGKAHVIGEKNKSDEKSSEKSADKKSSGKPSPKNKDHKNKSFGGKGAKSESAGRGGKSGFGGRSDSGPKPRSDRGGAPSGRGTDVSRKFGAGRKPAPFEESKPRGAFAKRDEAFLDAEPRPSRDRAKSPWESKGRGVDRGGSGRGGKKEFRGGGSSDGRGGGRGNDRGGRGGERGGRGNDRGGRAGGFSGRGGRGGESRGYVRPGRADNPDWVKLKGVIDKNKRGSAFLVFDRSDLEDVFIPRFYLEQLFHGDRVEASINEQGEIEDLKVLAHRFKEIFGRVHIEEQLEGRGKAKTKSLAGFLVYERKKAKEEVYIPALPPEVKNGDWVKAEIVFNEDGKGRAAAPIAKILEVIGQDLPAIYDIQMVAGEFNLKEHHSFDAVKQAESYTLDVRPYGSKEKGVDEEGRTDLRNIPFITIDGERARDFDDAVYVERDGTGYRLWVAIADVSHYVKVGTALDREALERGTSVYFPERAFHMLPRALSEELCSLKPHVPRLSMACSIDYNSEGVKGEVKVYNAIIESRRRSTYTEIQAEKDDPKHAEMFELYRLLRKTRNERGSIDFDFPEAEIILDEKSGEPTDIVVRNREDSNRLIEEFMIAANESVSEWMLARKRPFIFRVHEEPSPEAMNKFKKLAKNMGMHLADMGGVPKPHVLAEFIRGLVGQPSEPVLANALLRSMRQAIYTAAHGQHYGLASTAYSHFTSPIRRYPDLVVHRLLRATLASERPGNEEELEQIAEHCSYRERIASEAERESIRFKQVRLMAKHLGKEFEGKVSGISERGMYIQLDSPYCEGMVPVDSMKDDWYEFNEERMILAGRKKKITYTIGKRVKIQVTRVDLDARQVEFQLVSGE